MRIRCVNHEKSLRQVLFSGSGFCASRSLIGALDAPCFKAPESSVTWPRTPRFYAHEIPVRADASILGNCRGPVAPAMYLFQRKRKKLQSGRAAARLGSSMLSELKRRLWEGPEKEAFHLEARRLLRLITPTFSPSRSGRQEVHR